MDNLTIEKIEQKPVTNDKKVATQKPTSKSNNQIELQSQAIGPINVLVPVGWIKSPHEGGDFGGYQFTNPNDTNEQMLTVYSACAGCGYPNADPEAKPDPISLIPHETSQIYLYQSGLAAGYTYYPTGNSNTGDGVVKMVRREGYAYVEIVLPNSEKSIATKVLNSFQFLGF